MEVDAEDAASATTRDDEESEIASELGNIDIASADRAESANERLDLLVQFKLEELLEGPLRPTAALDAETWSNAANAVVAAFEELRQGAVQVVAEICDGERHTRGRAAKAQARWYQLKMATARKATTVALEQQAIRIAAQQDARSGEQEEVKKQLAEYKRRAARAEAKVKALEDEAGTTNDSLQNALELLDVTVGEKSTLVETVRELVLGCTAMRQERDDLQAEVLRMKAAGDPSTVMDDLKAARERIGELEGRHAEAQGELAGAHTRLEGMARVEVECKRCQDEIAECEQVLRDAFAQLNLKLAENEGLGEEVASLGEELGIKVEENMSLAEQLRELMNRGSDARAAEHARLQRLQAELDEMRAQAPQLDSLRAERRRLREELAQVEPKMCRLAELEASVEADATMRREHAEMSEILVRAAASSSAPLASDAAVSSPAPLASDAALLHGCLRSCH